MILTGLLIMILVVLTAHIIKTIKTDRMEKIGYKYY